MLIELFLVGLVLSCDQFRTIGISQGNDNFQLNLVLNEQFKSQVGSCHYQVANGTVGAVSIDTAGQCQGFYFDGVGSFDIYSARDPENPTKQYKTFRKPARSLSNSKCKDFIHPPVRQEFHENENKLKRKRRDASNNNEKILELIMVVSNGIYKNIGNLEGQDKNQRLKPVFERFEAVAHSLTVLYEMVNLRVVLLDIKIWDDKDLFEIEGKQSGEVLDSFKAWLREQKSNTKGIEKRRWHSYDNAQLVVPEGTFTDTATIGKGWVDVVCDKYYSNGVNEDHHSSHLGVAATMAHEMGHNLGLNHDSSNCDCRDNSNNAATCIMAASASSTHATHWSTCSQDRLKDKVKTHGCLDDTPESDLIYGEPVCGNGLLEKDEDCDCGTTDPSQCSSKCCNAETCKFKEGAQCDENDGPCCDNCNLRSAGSECRSAVSECDLPEYCDGWSGRCRNNVFKRNGELCSGGGRCMSGQCITRDTHCKYIYGPDSRHSSLCMDTKNYKRKDYDGNCGERFYGSGRTSGIWYSQCRTFQDAFCGKTQCVGGEPKTIIQEFGHVNIGKHKVVNESDTCKYMDWRNAHDSTSRDSDYNFDQMPIGTPCGDESVCDTEASGTRRLCRPLADLWQDSKWGTCPLNCTGRGWCNSNGNCHCFDGYGGETCSKRGAGGSIDSGHASAVTMDEGTKMFIIIFACLFGFMIVAAMVAKFKFNRNLTDICFYQPCAGNYRQNNYKHDNRNNQIDLAQKPNNDIFNPDWSDTRPTISSPIREDQPLKSSQYSVNSSPLKPLKPAKPVKPEKPPKPVKPAKPKPPPKNPKLTNSAPVDPFAVNWDDSSGTAENILMPHRTAPLPPKPPTPPPKDY